MGSHKDQNLICGVHYGAPHAWQIVDVSGTTECIGLRIVLSATSSEWEAGPECGAGWHPSSACIQASLVVPLCISLSCDLPKHPAPTQSPRGTFFGFHVSDYP